MTKTEKIVEKLRGEVDVLRGEIVKLENDRECLDYTDAQEAVTKLEGIEYKLTSRRMVLKVVEAKLRLEEKRLEDGKIEAERVKLSSDLDAIREKLAGMAERLVSLHDESAALFEAMEVIRNKALVLGLGELENRVKSLSGWYPFPSLHQARGYLYQRFPFNDNVRMDWLHGESVRMRSME